MFDFAAWAGWLRAEAISFSREGVTATYRDTISAPECAANPAFSIEVESQRRLGRLSVWAGGTCDYEVADINSGEFIADEAMLAATDETVPLLFAHFITFFDDEPG